MSSTQDISWQGVFWCNLMFCIWTIENCSLHSPFKHLYTYATLILCRWCFHIVLLRKLHERKQTKTSPKNEDTWNHMRMLVWLPLLYPKSLSPCYEKNPKILDCFDTNYTGCYSPFCYYPGTYKFSNYPCAVFF